MTTIEFDIQPDDIAQVYVSHHAYFELFEQRLPLRRFNQATQPTAGIHLKEKDSRIISTGMEKSTPAAQLPRWRTRIQGAWLRHINGTKLSTIPDVEDIIQHLHQSGATHYTLVLLYPKVSHGITNEGIPQVNIDQMNPRQLFKDDTNLPIPHASQLNLEYNGEVLNWVTMAMKLT
mmetsp:Transcript_32497/g.62168  ORF Transcript_32497/g.62168 Transcript_32497/m.62168 type:complete len:176 (+) Transcript_32497:201-728(+)